MQPTPGAAIHAGIPELGETCSQILELCSLCRHEVLLLPRHVLKPHVLRGMPLVRTCIPHRRVGGHLGRSPGRCLWSESSTTSKQTDGQRYLELLVVPSQPLLVRQCLALLHFGQGMQGLCPVPAKTPHVSAIAERSCRPPWSQSTTPLRYGRRAHHCDLYFCFARRATSSFDLTSCNSTVSCALRSRIWPSGLTTCAWRKAEKSSSSLR